MRDTAIVSLVHGERMEGFEEGGEGRRLETVPVVVGTVLVAVVKVETIVEGQEAVSPTRVALEREARATRPRQLAQG